jgi:GTPase SAR1 family protein
MIIFKHPFTMMIAGPSGCGKTTFTTNLIRNVKKYIQPSPFRIIWCNPAFNAVPTQLKNIEYFNNIPENINNKENNPILIILDDLMLSSYNSQVCELFTKGSHHRNLSVILITQNVFHQGKHCRDISLNCKYLVMFKNPRDKSQIMPLARQIYPENSKDFLKVYNEITSVPYGYIVLDLTQDINDIFRFRSNIFEDNKFDIYCTLNQLENFSKRNEAIEGESSYVASATKI